MKPNHPTRGQQHIMDQKLKLQCEAKEVEELIAHARNQLRTPGATTEDRKNRYANILGKGREERAAAHNSLKDISKALNCVLAPPKEKLPLFSMTSGDTKK